MLNISSLIPDNEVPASEPYSFAPEIQKMMFGFGDNGALEETARLVEIIVKQQVGVIIYKAADVCEMRGVKNTCLEDVLFVMRRNKVLIHRYLNHLDVKELKSGLYSQMEPSSAEGKTEIPKKQRQKCIDFIESIDQFGDMLEPCADIEKHERIERQERFTRNMDFNIYEEYTVCRTVSFLQSGSSSKFLEWVQSAEWYTDIPKLQNDCLELLAFLAFETVAKIVDLAFLVREDAATKPSDPFTPKLPSPNTARKFQELPPPNKYFQQGGPPPICVAEIQEALRRWWGPMSCHATMFTREPTPNMSNSLLVV